MATQLQNEVEKIAYDLLLKQQPGMIKVIREALEKGESVKQLARFAEKRGSPLVAGLIEQAAAYMKRTDMH